MQNMSLGVPYYIRGKKIGKLHSDVQLDIKLECHLSLLLMFVKKHSALQYCPTVSGKKQR